MKISNCCGENMEHEEIAVCPDCEERCEIIDDEEIAKVEDNKETIRENLINRLNEIKDDEVLILFNEYLNGTLDNQIDSVISEWSDDEFKEFLDFAESRDIVVEKNL